jgi:hypothetical protein
MDASNLPYAWLTISIVLVLALQMFLWITLRRHGIRTWFFLVGTPGYLDSKYIAWRRREGKNYIFIIALRILTGLNVIASAFLVINTSP